MNTNMNYYEILGVKEDASFEEIKQAYKTQMKKWHPDINKSSDAINMSSKINEAKEVLLDEIKRKDYDLYLKNKIDEDYNRYTQNKTASSNNNNTNESSYNNNYETKQNEEKMVTKWQYLSDWLKFTDVPVFRKIIGVIGVLIESFICFIIKSLLIVLSFVCYILSDIIKMGLSYLAPIIGIIGALFLFMCFTDGFNSAINNNSGLFKALIILVITFISSFLLPLLGNLLISKKVFNILYNKIDISLFKKCVGIKS